MADEILPLPPTVPDVSWVTLDELKAQLYITSTVDDAALTQLGTECSTAILLYLHPRGDATWTAATVPSDVKQAVKRLATAYWTDRGDDPKGSAGTVWTDIGLLLARRKDLVIA